MLGFSSLISKRFGDFDWIFKLGMRDVDPVTVRDRDWSVLSEMCF